MPCRLFEDVSNLLASREKVIEAKKLSGAERLALLQTKTRLDEDAVIRSTNIRSYSVMGFINFLCQYSSEIAFYEERAGQFFPADIEYEQFVRDTLSSVVDAREKERKMEELAIRKKQESLKRLNSLPNAYEKHVFALSSSLTRFLDAPMKRRSQRHRSVSSRLVSTTRGTASSPAQPKKPTERTKEITHITSERFWKSVESVYRRLLPKLNELVDGFVPDEIMPTRLLPTRTLKEEWSSPTFTSEEKTVR